MTFLRTRPLAVVAGFIAACVAVTAQAPDSQDTARAAWRTSLIAQTTRDWPRRTSPAANTLATLVA